MRTILNPYYILKPDNGRAFLQVKDEVRAKESERYNIILHPIFAMILSCFDGDDYESSINRAANYLHLDKALVRKFVDKITENENFIKIIFDNRTVYFPSVNKKKYLTFSEIHQLVIRLKDTRNIAQQTLHIGKF